MYGLVLMISSALLIAAIGSPVVDLYLVPHTHADVGWMQTVNSLSRINISRILDGVTEELTVNPARRFVWDEMVFLQLWWETQATPAQRAAFTKQIVSRRIECNIALMLCTSQHTTPCHPSLITLR